jgi:hypothetical protein
MEKMYTAYTKVMEGQKLFFVKGFLVFPDLKEVPPVLENYGMHTQFEKACQIALLFDENIKQQLLAAIAEQETASQPLAKVISLSEAQGFEGNVASGM